MNKPMTESRIHRKWRKETKERIRGAQKSQIVKTLQILETRVEEWQNCLPGWLGCPAINCDAANMRKAEAAISVAMAIPQHLRIITELATAGLDGPLGNQTRSAEELYVNMEWLRRFDNPGRLSKRFEDWNSVQRAKTHSNTGFRNASIKNTKAKYPDKEDWGPDGWARPDPKKGRINQAGRAVQVIKAVRHENAGDQSLEFEPSELDDERIVFNAVLNSMSHGNTTFSTLIYADSITADMAAIFCYWALQSCWLQLLTLTDGISPSPPEEAARKRIDEVAGRLRLLWE